MPSRTRTITTLLLALGVAGTLPAQAERAPKSRPKPAVAAAVTDTKLKPMDITPYKLPDDTFWTSPQRGADPLATELVGHYEGLLIDAPRRVLLDRRTTLPAGVYQIGKIRDVSSLHFKDAGMVVAMDVTANRMMLATSRSLDPDEDPVPPSGKHPTQMPEGNMASTETLELRNAFGLAWKPGRLLLTAVLRNQVSNRVAVELCQSPACPSVPPSIAAKATPVVSPTPLPNYQPLADSLPVPAQPGLVIDGARDQANDLGWQLRGAFRLRPAAHEWVKAGAHPDKTKPVAVVAVWLLLVGATDGSVHTVALHVPSLSRKGDVCTGQFSIDLRSMPTAPRVAQTYFVYAFSGESMAGPLSLPLAMAGVAAP